MYIFIVPFLLALSMVLLLDRKADKKKLHLHAYRKMKRAKVVQVIVHGWSQDIASGKEEKISVPFCRPMMLRLTEERCEIKACTRTHQRVVAARQRTRQTRKNTHCVLLTDAVQCVELSSCRSYRQWLMKTTRYHNAALLFALFFFACFFQPNKNIKRQLSSWKLV